ncbi:MAG: hypothetical protein K8I82_30250 [Anaerolineae bacterium]|nr:hypothetical protein [Anaerolineae bacterium]
MPLPPDDWMPEEPPDLYFSDVVVDEPPWLYDEPPLDADIMARLDRYGPSIPSAADYRVPDEVYADPPDMFFETGIAPQGIPTPASHIERDTSWQLQHSQIMIEAIQSDPHADPTGYAVGVVEVWQDPQTGDQAGTYLHMADAPYLQRAEEMQSNIYRLVDEAGVSEAEFGNFAHGLIKGRGEWQPLTDAQWRQVDNTLAPDTPNFDDDVLWAERDRLLAQAFEAVESEPPILPNYDQAVKDLGIQIEGFDPNTTPPPLFDAKTNTAYWIGVYQDPETPDQGITSLLSIQMDENDTPQARLAPVAMGDLDHAQRTAEYLLTVAERTQDVGQMLDAAESMAVATQHRELWEAGQGIAVEADIVFSPSRMEID